MSRTVGAAVFPHLMIALAASSPIQAEATAALGVSPAETGRIEKLFAEALSARLCPSHANCQALDLKLQIIGVPTRLSITAAWRDSSAELVLQRSAESWPKKIRSFVRKHFDAPERKRAVARKKTRRSRRRRGATAIASRPTAPTGAALNSADREAPEEPKATGTALAGTAPTESASGHPADDTPEPLAALPGVAAPSENPLVTSRQTAAATDGPHWAPWVLIGTSAVAAAAATGFGMSSRSARATLLEPRYHPDEEQDRLSSRAVQHGWASNILGGAAITSLATGVLWLILED